MRFYSIARHLLDKKLISILLPLGGFSRDDFFGRKRRVETCVSMDYAQIFKDMEVTM